MTTELKTYPINETQYNMLHQAETQKKLAEIQYNSILGTILAQHEITPLKVVSATPTGISVEIAVPEVPDEVPAGSAVVEGSKPQLVE